MGSCHSSKTPFPSSQTSWLERENLEFFTLIWLDNTIEKKKSIQAQFRRIINSMRIFSNLLDCEEYLKRISNDEYIIFILNDQAGKHILQHTHHLEQIFSIYIYSTNENIDPTWMNQFPKIKSICKNHTELLDQLKSDQSRWEYIIHNQLVFDVFHPERSGEFLYAQILIEVLRQMEPMKNDMSELFSRCRGQYKGNAVQLKRIRELEENYSDANAIWWWTEETFLSKLFTKAWKKRNLDLIFLFRFFLHDLEKQLQQYQCLTPIQVYRYQSITKKDFELFKQSIGQFISINTFLLTSIHRDAAMPSFVHDDYQLILLEISADSPLEKIKPFGRIHSPKSLPNQVLFMCGSIFQLQNIRQQDKELAIIALTLTSRIDPQLKPAFDAFKTDPTEDDDDEINLLSFGDLLQKLNLSPQAEQYYNRLFIELPDDDERLGCCCLNLGRLSYLKTDYESSLEWLLKSLDISIRTRQSNDRFLAGIYHTMGQVYQARNDWKFAIESYDKAMIIWRQSLDEHHLHIIECLTNIAMIYKHEKDYLLVLKSFEKILVLIEKYLPHDHLDRSKIHWNIASTYRQLEEYDFALAHYNFALKILEENYSSDHPNIAKALGNIGIVYACKGDRQHAAIYYAKAAEIYQRTYPSIHPNNIKMKQLIENLSSPHRRLSLGAMESK